MLLRVKMLIAEPPIAVGTGLTLLIHPAAHMAPQHTCIRHCFRI